MHRPSLKPARILVVENEASTRDLIVQHLQSSGFGVLCAGTGEAALLILRRERETIEWLVTAIELPGLVCGAMLADEYRMLHPNRVVICTSGESSRCGPCSSRLTIPRRDGMPLELTAHLQDLTAAKALEPSGFTETFAQAA